MRIQKLICNHENAPLVLVFLGYAFTPDCLKNFDFQNCDVAVVYENQKFKSRKNFNRLVDGRVGCESIRFGN